MGMGAETPPQWRGVNKHLIAKIYPCDARGNPLQNLGDDVLAPISDGSFDATFNWQSPFENVGPESKLPSLMAMLQSGALTPVITAIQQSGASAIMPESSVKLLNDAKAASATLEGRTGITKVNSRQIFSGMPPVKLTMTLHFRAISNPRAEVIGPLNRLMEWAVPAKLSTDGAVVSSIKGSGGMLDVLFPSTVPQMVALVYGGRTMKPLVIEGISHPMDVERDSDGNEIALAVHLSLASLTAIDSQDVRAYFQKT